MRFFVQAGADKRGVDILQNCEVQDIVIEGGCAVAVDRGAVDLADFVGPAEPRKDKR